MKTRKILIAVMALGSSLAARGQTTEIQFNGNEKYQTIDNFAASDCWYTEYVGRYFSNANKEKAARWLFSTDVDGNGNPKGIGLSSWRVNIGAGSATQGTDSGIEDETRRVDCYLQSDGTYDWSKCPGQQYFMQKAKSYGVNDFVMFSNSAPIYYTKNGYAHNSFWYMTTCNLKDDKFDDFAEFLATTAKHFTDEGYNISMISPVNEPQYDWQSGQEGSHWRNSDITKLVKELNTSITSRNISTKILIPEAAKWNNLYTGSSNTDKQISAFFNSSSSSTYVGNLPTVAKVCGAHSYYTFGSNTDLQNIRSMAWTTAQQYGVKLYQTEWSLLDDAPSSDTGFPSNGYDGASYTDIALFMAKVIQCDLKFANVSSWSYWTSMAPEQYGQKDRFYLLRIKSINDTGNENYTPITDAGVVTDGMTLWAYGNFSFFIRPGFTRIGMSGADEMNGLLGTSYLSPDGNRLVCVIVNTGQAARSVRFSMDGINLNGATINKYVTDSGHRLMRDLTLDRQYNGGEIGISARSVTTITFDLPPKFLKGDVNGDGEVDIADINETINQILGRGNPDHLIRADVNEDGEVDIADINLIIGIMLS